MAAVQEAIVAQENRAGLTTTNQVELFAKAAVTVTSATKVMTGTSLVSYW